jgi:hypothetical protein
MFTFFSPRLSTLLDRDIGLSAKTVGELRKMTEWPENLVISTPQDRDSQSAIRVSKGHTRDPYYAKIVGLGQRWWRPRRLDSFSLSSY